MEYDRLEILEIDVMSPFYRTLSARVVSTDPPNQTAESKVNTTGKQHVIMI